MNAIELAREVHERYKRYLKTTFYFRDPDLRSSFQQALDAGDLSKGPYLEATPVFKPGRTPSALLRELFKGQLDDGFLAAILGDRPLYRHQEEAIRRVVSGRNVVVATGTASGKTEAFLYPILAHLYNEFVSGNLGPGVRALILYPMNALANDQRERLGEICRQLEHRQTRFRFTFGQYIGETPEDENDSRRHAQEHVARRLPGELVLRTEIRARPPHVLLTNYSMLEYLLLRPHDSPLFDDGRARWWTFLVLDEAHQYRGSKGIETAMLLRRLKQRLREGGRDGPFRCVATSATLAGGPQDGAQVARFASDLFGEPFAVEDVVLAEAERVPDAPNVRLEPDVYQRLQGALRLEAQATVILEGLSSRLGFSVDTSEGLPSVLGRVLMHDGRAVQLRQAVAGGCRDVAGLGNELFSDLPESQRVAALAALVDLLLLAVDPETEAPLLSARYHLFLRSLEGAFVSYRPEKRVFLERRGQQADQAAFEVALCRECGQHYFVGRISGGHLREAIRDPSDPDFGATFYRPLDQEAQRSDEEEEGPQQAEHLFWLCMQCASIGPASGVPAVMPCGHDRPILVEEQAAAREREDQVPRCSACGYQAPDPVREVIHGADGPHAVIATTLYQRLPEDRRKVLAFADSRQEAAFFAWYLDQTYRDVLNRNLTYQALDSLAAHASNGLTLRELATALRDSYREKRVFPPTYGDLELRREAWLRLYREFLSEEVRISLEGVGLCRWSIAWPDDFVLPEILRRSPWSLGEQESFDLLMLLLGSARADAAVELVADAGVSVKWDDIGVRASQSRLRIGLPRGQKNVRSWDGERTRRARLLTKCLVARGLDEDEARRCAVETLRHIWQAIIERDRPHPSRERLMMLIDDGRRLNPLWWRARLVAPSDLLFQCDTCARISGLSPLGLCPRPGCPGHLQKTTRGEIEPNHYRSLYQEELPGVLRVEEHTAQLAYEKAREFQRDFRQGNIHVLSCSTTFELGVDLGDLDSIFLRNVPPEPFNYAQRVGRAGRRPGRPGFAVAYCRRGPHDLYHFAQPEQIVNGVIRPPVLSLTNGKIIGRHVAADALSRFFRQNPDRFGSVAALCGDLNAPSASIDFQRFLERRNPELARSLLEIVPSNMVGELGLDSGRWAEDVAGPDSRFALAEIAVSSDYRTVRALESESASRGDYSTARWAQSRARTIAEEDVLSFLSRMAVIPKYGFPVDVVELDLQRIQQSSESGEIALQRDLAIAVAEFAPTCQLVANKKEWKSYALKRVPEKEWPRRHYVRCNEHNTFQAWSPGEVSAPFSPCCRRAVNSSYVIPRFGFVADRSGPKPPRGRPLRVFTTRPYFAGFQGIAPEEIDLGLMRLTKASPGTLVVICEGRRGEGFYICLTCGAGFRRRQISHTNPFGMACSGTLERLSLGHELVTDVMWVQFCLPLGRQETDPAGLARGLAYALVEGVAAFLEVPSTDLDATVLASSLADELPPIVVYDNVPGGAGLVARLEDKVVLRECLLSARERVSGKCRCDENTSCYGCLRTYRNQFAHSYLQRGPVLRYLEAVLSAF
jgi:hypothetical protein